MAKTLTNRQILHAPSAEEVQPNGIVLLLDSERDNWIGTDTREKDLLGLVNGKRTFGEIVAEYAREQKMAPDEAQQHASTFFGHLLRRNFLSRESRNRDVYPGRAGSTQP